MEHNLFCFYESSFALTDIETLLVRRCNDGDKDVALLVLSMKYKPITTLTLTQQRS
uniref:Uncharacterized protein n=1 Tax=Anguilla anguilla TaxID=7936 RepID=A0A0E9TTK6_ANGAN